MIKHTFFDDLRQQLQAHKRHTEAQIFHSNAKERCLFIPRNKQRMAY